MAKAREGKSEKDLFPESLTPEERAHYSDMWGFDPVSDKIVEDTCLYYYQTNISLEKDPDLGSTGIELYVRVFLYPRGECICSILFHRGEKEDEIDEIFAEIGRDYEELLVQAISDKVPSLAMYTVKKIPWVRFAALKSLVEGWVKNGLLNGITHLNPYFYTRILQGLHRVAGTSLHLNKYIITRLINEFPPEWFADRWMLWTDGGRELEKIYSLKNNIFNNFPFLKSLDGILRVKWLKVLLALHHSSFYSVKDESASLDTVTEQYSPDIFWLTITDDSVDKLDVVTIGMIWDLMYIYLSNTNSYVRSEIYPEVPRLLEAARLLLQSGLKRKLNVDRRSFSFSFESLKEIEEEWKREETESKETDHKWPDEFEEPDEGSDLGKQSDSKRSSRVQRQAEPERISSTHYLAAKIGICSPESLTLKERAYYREAWGFDPVADKKVSPPRPDVLYYYESSIPLENDPEIRAVGIMMHARVEVDADGRSHNRIVFTRGEKSVAVECVHTAVYAAPPREISELSKEKLKVLGASTGGRPVILPPWEHFASLKSFAGGIAAVGILWSVDQVSPIELENYLLSWWVGQDSFNRLKKRSRDATDPPIPLEMIDQILSAVFKLVPDLLQSLGIDVLLALGTQLVHKGFEDRAILYLEQATRLNLKSVDAWYYLGLAYAENERYLPAIHAFELALKLNPEHADTWLNLGSVLGTMGDKKGSKEAFQRWEDLTGSLLPPSA